MENQALAALIRIYGWSHEGLHVVALRLIGRRAVQVTTTHVDIPADLSTSQYVFVAGLPALVFWGAAVLCARALFTAPGIVQGAIWFILTGIAGIAAAGTLGGLLLIFGRIVQFVTKPPTEE